MEPNINTTNQSSDSWKEPTKVAFTGVKVFSATKARDREELGEQVTRWLRANSGTTVIDKIVTQSSDREFHCLTITLFFQSSNDNPSA